MQETGGRRIKRSINIKQSSISFIESDKELEKFKRIQSISKYIDERSAEIKEYNTKIGADKSIPVNGRNLTNIGLLRAYVLEYLHNHKDIRQDMMIMVRRLNPSSKGIPLELYIFANTTVWAIYEGIVSDVFDHLLAAAKYFDLEIFEDVSNPIVGLQQQKVQLEAEESINDK